MEKLKCDIKFLLHCKRTKLIPTFAGPQLSINADSNLTSKISQLLIETELENKHKLKQSVVELCHYISANADDGILCNTENFV